MKMPNPMQSIFSMYLHQIYSARLAKSLAFTFLLLEFENTTADGTSMLILK